MRTILVTYSIGLLLCITAIGAKAQYREKYRPQYHFSPEKGWMGDPDGLVFTDNKYHLFWWGHAVSEDLVHWKELPYPMKGGNGKFSYFSGSVIVDKKNTAGFGANSMIAFYTKHLPGVSLPETQAISVSNDGIYFNYYSNNPVLDIGKIFFRDPQVFWYAPEQKWKMVVALPAEHKVQIYESPDAKRWTFCSDFGGLGARSAFWECPDLFEVSMRDEPGKKKWIMMIGRGPNRVQYFVGDFDGKKFTPDVRTERYLVSGEGISGQVFEDFEDSIAGEWTIAGTAFDHLRSRTDSCDHMGKGFVSSESQSGAGGELTSPAFKISKPAVNFLISGANNAETCIELVVGGKVVRSTSGDGSKVLKWNGWDVNDLVGKTATIRIKDTSLGKGESITVDHICFSDQLLNHKLEHALWMDYGSDFYATRTWRDVDNVSNRTVAIAWMGNWDYARKAPSSWGKGFQSIPRVFNLKNTDAGIRLVQTPLPELQRLRNNIQQRQNILIKSGNVQLFTPSRNVYELDLEFKPLDAGLFGADLLVGEGRKLRLSYDPKTSVLCLDRTSCTDFISDPQFNQAFAVEMKAPLHLQNGLLKLKIFVDQSSVEVFSNDGEVVLSAVTYPSERQLGVSFFSEGGSTMLQSLKAWELSSIWNNSKKNNQ